MMAIADPNRTIVGTERTPTFSSCDLSVVIPVYNERGALPGLIDEVGRVCGQLQLDWEIVVVDDGSTDGTTELLEQFEHEHDRLHLVRLRRNVGKSAALMAGFEHSAGETLITMDGDGQDDPAEIPALIDKLDQGYDLVSGWKRHRRDPPVKRWSSRLFNRVTARVSGLKLHDFNSGLKAYSRRCVRSLDVYGELHRFIPVLASQAGWRVSELPVNHRPRVHGGSKFGAARYSRGLFDLMTVVFLGRYRQRPMHLFGGIGLILMLAGIAISIYLTILKLGGSAIGERPLLLLGVLMIMVGAQFLTFGLLGQLIAAMAYEGGRSQVRKYEMEPSRKAPGVFRDQRPGEGNRTVEAPQRAPSSRSL
jgi:glycosyltransferase involved in cell wall biosynthesis